MVRDIIQYMNTFGEKQYTILHASLIGGAISTEFKDRKANDIYINTRTKAGRELLNTRIADIVNRAVSKTNYVTSRDVWVYKKADALERQDRTGKCMWGFKEKRKAYGYDENTGKELDI